MDRGEQRGRSARSGEHLQPGLPEGYSKLSSHLKSGSTAFDHRMDAYLVTQVAIRKMLLDALQRNADTPASRSHKQPNEGPYAVPAYGSLLKFPLTPLLRVESQQLLFTAPPETHPLIRSMVLHELEEQAEIQRSD